LHGRTRSKGVRTHAGRLAGRAAVGIGEDAHAVVAATVGDIGWADLRTDLLAIGDGPDAVFATLDGVVVKASLVRGATGVTDLVQHGGTRVFARGERREDQRKNEPASSIHMHRSHFAGWAPSAGSIAILAKPCSWPSKPIAMS
jgi:hypothetical protein